MLDWISCSILNILADSLCNSFKMSYSVLDGPLDCPGVELVVTVTVFGGGGHVLVVTTGLTLVLTLELTLNTAEDAIIACDVVLLVAILNL